jgi:uroporphyrinogen-III synthase
VKALVTRPELDAAPVAAALAARGIESVLAPMSRIVWAEDGARQLSGALAGVQAVLFASANGARAFGRASTRLELPSYCVGEASAAAARIAGFRAVFSADGDVADLADLAASRLAPGNCALLHASGDRVAGDLGRMLGAKGFTVRRVVLYRAEPATELPAETVATLRRGEIGLALFFSPRAARTFVRLARDGGIAETCDKVTSLGLSAKVAAALNGLPWRAVVSAVAPNLQAMFAALDEALARPMETRNE